MKITATAALGILAAFLAACSSGTTTTTTSSSSPAAPSAKGGAKTIGISIQDLEAQFYQQMEAGLQAEAKKYGYKLLIADANRDNARQQSQVEDYISKHVDAIVLTPYESKAIGSAIAEANNANIPVFTADIANTSNQGKVISHVASNNIAGGQLAGQLMCKALNGHGTIAILDQPEVTSAQDRVKGFKAYLQQHCPAVTIVADIDAGGSRAEASSDMGDVLQRYKNLSGVFGINDDSALGALTAMRAAGVSNIAVVGYDGSPEARTAISQGRMYGDPIQHPDVIGKDMIDVIAQYFAGKKVPARIDVPVATFTKANASK